MRGKDEQQLDVFSYINPEQRVPQDHPLRPLRVMTDEALQQLRPWLQTSTSEERSWPRTYKMSPSRFDLQAVRHSKDPGP